MPAALHVAKVQFCRVFPLLNPQLPEIIV